MIFIRFRSPNIELNLATGGRRAAGDLIQSSHPWHSSSTRAETAFQSQTRVFGSEIHCSTSQIITLKYGLQLPIKAPERILEVLGYGLSVHTRRKTFSNTFFWEQLAIFGQKILKDTYLEMALNFFWITRADIPGLRLDLERHSEFRKKQKFEFSNTSR